MLDENINLGVARTTLLGLVVECPQGSDGQCVLSEKRLLPFSAKFQWVQSLPPDELLNLYRRHCRCTLSRRQTQN